MKEYEYHAHICNNIIYGGLVQLRASGVPNDDIRVMMKCIGDTFARMSFDDKSIEYYMKSFENFENPEHTYTYDQMTQDLIDKMMVNIYCAKPIEDIKCEKNETDN